MISNIKYVVVAAPRSATGWASEVLTRMGLHCGHERHFLLGGCEFAADLPSDRIWGDASWMAVPFIDKLPAGTTVLHQVRNPADAIGSLVMLRHFVHWDHAIDDYHVFMRTHMMDAMPEGEIRKAAHFWLRWNEMIEAAVARRRDLELRYVRYCVEAYGIVRNLYREITDHDPSGAVLAEGLAVPTDFNHKRGRAKQVVSMHTLSSEVNAMARRYGYGQFKR